MREAENKIRAAFVINSIFTPSGGTERQLLFLLRHLDREIFDPHLFCLHSSPWLEEEFDACPLHVVGIRSFKSPLFLRRLGAFSATLRRERFDLVQTQFGDANTVGILAARMAGVPIIISTRRGVSLWASRAGLSLLRFLNSQATCFIANSQATRKLTVETEGVAPEKIEVIYNGIDPEVCARKGRGREEVRRMLGIPRDAPVVGIVANLRPVKGIDVFIRAAALVADERADAVFLIVGGGEEQESLTVLAQNLGLGERVRFLGTRLDVPSLLGAMDVGVLSSHYESFSNAILEYLAAGLPVVCTDVGGCREVVEDGRNGYIVGPGDASAMAEKILILLQNGFSSRERKRMEQRLKNEFSIEAMVQGHQQFYLRLLQGAEARQEGMKSGAGGSAVDNLK